MLLTRGFFLGTISIRPFLDLAFRLLRELSVAN